MRHDSINNFFALFLRLAYNVLLTRVLDNGINCVKLYFVTICVTLAILYYLTSVVSGVKGVKFLSRECMEDSSVCKKMIKLENLILKCAHERLSRQEEVVSLYFVT